jgi:ribosome-associated translation inhibitor RaiA
MELVFPGKNNFSMKLFNREVVMNAKVSFHNVDHSEALQKFILEKSKKLSNLFWKGEGFSWVVEKDADSFRPLVNLKLRDKKVQVRAESHNPFKAVKLALRKAEKLVVKSHNKHSP